jgi:hypothetical protein
MAGTTNRTMHTAEPHARKVILTDEPMGALDLATGRTRLEAPRLAVDEEGKTPRPTRPVADRSAFVLSAHTGAPTRAMTRGPVRRGNELAALAAGGRPKRIHRFRARARAYAREDLGRWGG